MFILPHLKGLTAGNIGSAVFKNASLDLKFADNKSLVDAVTGASLITFTRASGGTVTDSAGVLQTAVTNLLLRSEEFNDAGAWTKVGTTVSANSITSPNGALTADTLVEDTSTGTHRCVAAPTIANTTVCTVSVYAKAAGRTHMRLSVSGGLAGELTANLSNGTVAASSGATNPTVQSVGDDWYRVSFTTAASTSTSAQVTFSCIQGTSTSSYTGDGTSGIYLWGAQLEQSATVGEYIPTTSAINSAPRFDHNPTTGESLGLLVEEARTNSIRNNTMVGAVAGTPGTIPTNWTGSSTTSGITREIVGTGIENGINYIDYRIAGTTTGALFFLVSPEGSTSVAATNGQTWTFSSYARLIAGSLAGFTSINFYIAFNSSIGAGLQFVTGGITPTSAALNTQRFTRTGTASNALIAFVQPAIQFEAPTGTSIDITLRIGLPQLEQGATVSSVIPTTTAAATRSADVASIGSSAFTSFYNQSEGTWFGDVFREFAVPASQFPVIVDCRTSGGSPDINQFSYLLESLAGSLITVGGVTQSELYPTGLTGVRRRRIATAYAANNFAASANGSTPLIDSTGSVGNPSSMTIGAVTGGTQYLNGHIRRLVYWGQRLPNNVLQAITQ